MQRETIQPNQERGPEEAIQPNQERGPEEAIQPNQERGPEDRSNSAEPRACLSSFGSKKFVTLFTLKFFFN